jgi:hypothetical protein
MEEVTGGGGREGCVENFSNESIGEVVYIEWRLGERAIQDDIKV